MKTKEAILEKSVENQPLEKSNSLVIKEIDIQKSGKHEVMIKVMAAGLCQSDVSVIKGYIDRPKSMAIGHEAAGIVYEVGEDVGNFKPGDKVVTTFVSSSGKCFPCSEGRPALCELGIESNKKGELYEGGTRFIDNNQQIFTQVFLPFQVHSCL